MQPKHHYDANDSQVYNDTEWISQKIGMLPISIQRDIATKYSDNYLLLSKTDPMKCRFRCNAWLRKTVDKYKVTDTEGYF